MRRNRQKSAYVQMNFSIFSERRKRRTHSKYQLGDWAVICDFILSFVTLTFLCRGVKSLWRPEYGAYMIEGTPGQPYGGLTAHFNVVEANMHYRRQEIQELLEPNEVLMSLTSFPR